ncbi:hypothetical protein M9978_17540 [Sphingomonas sp. MG17]|uniref:Uncharacterized protein n=1 Tax=Sphingomonas tagetis TaxID=2949092 RepID=A0A9X2HLA2_9SPHN|nr:hypothetical protein [Sphingomonas tagetis]MCP3732227.1 hypothetical protein [Sphingomonas tagetis]
MKRGIPSEVDLAAGQPWSIYSVAADRLPTSPGRVLLTVAVEDIVRRVRAARAPSMRPPESYGLVADAIPWAMDRTKIASDLADLLRHHHVSSTGRRVGGGSPMTLTRTHWDGDGHHDVVATGVIHIEVNPGGWIPHWVFVEAAEVELVASTLESVARPNSPFINAEYQWPLRIEQMADGLLRNVRAIIGVETVIPPSQTLATSELNSLISLLATERMSPVQRDAVVDQAATWLAGIFATETQREGKNSYRQKAVAKFGEAVAGGVFDDVWKAATRQAPGRRKGGRIPRASKAPA